MAMWCWTPNYSAMAYDWFICAILTDLMAIKATGVTGVQIGKERTDTFVQR